ncbi:MAG: MBL fold metallo-hydrolase [Methanotrichaceae archaeon]|nr:MBL fold metallo-hydrolase [Methanotrichaceae archaeon]
MKITDRIHALKIPFQVSEPSGRKVSRFVYIYLIYDEEICLIDSGVAFSEGLIRDYLKDTGRRPGEISLLILTHAHPDHIGAAAAIKEMSDCSVAAHSADQRWIENTDQQLMDRPVPGFEDLVSGKVRVDRILKDGDVIDLGDDSRLCVLHTPGHSPGSISLWMPSEKVLFPADAIPVAGEMPIYDDIRSSAKSIQRLRSIGDIKMLLSAWDDPRFGEDAYRAMDEGLNYLQKIHCAVIKSAGPDAYKDPIETDVPKDPMEICRRTIGELGLPGMMANPLTARSFQSSLNLLDRRDLLVI